MTDIIDKNIQFHHKRKPYDHQQLWLDRTWEDEFHAAFWEMGTGKTKLILDTAALLYIDEKIDGLLVVAPKGAYLNWVFNEIPEDMTDGIDFCLAYWSSSIKKKEKNAVINILKPARGALDILCINTEALSKGRGTAIALNFVKNHRTLMCVDESTAIKGNKSNRTKSCKKLSRLVPYRRILTGTPVTQSPLDLFSQCNFLRHGIIGFTSFSAFKNYYAIIIQMRMGTRVFPKITGYRNVDELKRKIMTFSSRVVKEECLDLPEKSFSTVYVELSPEQQQAYDELRRTSVITLGGEMITVTSILTALIKLHQIICGHVKDETGRVIDIPNNRISVLLETIENIQGKVIVWCHFIRDVQLIEKALKEHYGDVSTVSYYSDTGDMERVEACQRFQEVEGCRFFVATSAASKGLTLTACHYNIYFSHSYSLENYLQSQDRTHRIGQTKNVHYTSIVAPKTIDEKILKILEEKKNVADYLMNHWEEFLADF